MNRIKFTLTTLMRSLPIRGEDGWVAPRSVMALVAVCGPGGPRRRGAEQRYHSLHSGNTKPLDHHRSDL